MSRYPAFIAEMALPANRPKLILGVASGYAVSAGLALLAAVGHLQGFLVAAWPLYALIAIKLATNTAALLAIRTDRWVLEANGLNTTADTVLMTVAIYLTGGPVSPLFSIYVIEILAVALLSNFGVTAIVCAQVLICYAAMSLSMIAGVLPAHPQPIEVAGGELTGGYVLTDLGARTLVIGALAVFIGLILRILRDRERRLADRTSEVIEAGEQKARFMANVTHELRTPLHGILGLSELITTGVYGATTDKQRWAHEQITASARNLLQMVDDLLELSKHDAGVLELRGETVDAGELVAEVIASARWMLGTIEMEVSSAVEGEPVLVTDRGKLKQIVMNLISNAIKFTPEGGRVEVRTRAAAGGVEIEVTDTGRGIPEDQLERIFDEFRQLEGSAMEREYGGVGLGLAMVKRLVGLLGGAVSVSSTVGAGSRFTVWLPGDALSRP
jgi:signal transduction histidine kinase